MRNEIFISDANLWERTRSNNCKITTHNFHWKVAEILQKEVWIPFVSGVEFLYHVEFLLILAGFGSPF